MAVIDADKIKNSLERGLVKFYVGIGCLAIGLVTATMTQFEIGGESLRWAAGAALWLAAIFMSWGLSADDKTRKIQEPNRN